MTLTNPLVIPWPNLFILFRYVHAVKMVSTTDIFMSTYGKGQICNIYHFTLSRPVIGPTHASLQWVPGALSLGVKRSWCEADYSPPISAEVKIVWIYISTPPYGFMV
jgi:hypothetical protein